MNVECVACEGCAERRIDRMSYHLLKEHRASIIAHPKNEEILTTCVKKSKGYVNIYVKGLNKTEKYWVSFGYVSGWIKEPTMKKALEAIEENKCQHLVECNKLLTDIAKEKDKKVNGDITEEDMKRNEALTAKYKAEVGKNVKLNDTIKRLRANADKNIVVMETLCRLFNIDGDTSTAIENIIGKIYNDYCDDDDDTKEVRDDMISKINMNDVKEEILEAKKDAEDGW